MKKLKVICGCEESQAVCLAFRALGHEAYSCDLLPASGGHPLYHYHDDIFNILEKNYFDLGIFFPPCTHLAVSGAKHFAAKRADGRQQEAIDFFMALVHAKVERSAIENPVGIMSTEYRKPDQIVQPYMFGDPFTKTTCLWLKNLPLLTPTNIVDKGERHVTKGGNSLPAWYNLPPSADRARLRSKTFPGLALAFANQWSKPFNEQLTLNI